MPEQNNKSNNNKIKELYEDRSLPKTKKDIPMPKVKPPKEDDN